jgi:hypothetical protein
MGAPTNYYVDPSLDADTGNGAINTPFGDLQYCLNTITRDAVNGDQVNVKAGTAEVLAAALDFSSYGAAASVAPFILKGYTTAANDGGLGEIDINGEARLTASASLNYIICADLELYNSTSRLLSGGLGCSASGIWGHGSVNGFGFSSGSVVENCRIEGMEGGWGLLVSTGATINGNYFANIGTDRFSFVIRLSGSEPHVISRNIMYLDGASSGIEADALAVSMCQNSIFSNGGTGIGIEITDIMDQVVGNIVEGFSGVGGIGIDDSATSGFKGAFANNAAYNNTADYSGLHGFAAQTGDGNLTLTASPFAKIGTGNAYADRAAWFALNGEAGGGFLCKNTSWPGHLSLDIGAVQHSTKLRTSRGRLIHTG